MRKIKFRGKRIDNNEWINGQLLYFKSSVDEDEMAVIVAEWTNNNEWFNLGKRAKVNPETLGQYIGLKDKNGKEIYEGDILRQVDLIRVVKKEMSCGSCCTQVIGFGASGKGHLDFIDFDKTDTIEVIGNIYDNPELSKEG